MFKILSLNHWCVSCDQDQICFYSDLLKRQCDDFDENSEPKFDKTISQQMIRYGFVIAIFSNQRGFLNAYVDSGAQELGRHLQVWSCLRSELFTQQDVH